jgi:hypothetical protein
MGIRCFAAGASSPRRLAEPFFGPSGRAFRTRCPCAIPAGAEAVPPLRSGGPDHFAGCIRDELALRPATV